MGEEGIGERERCEKQQCEDFSKTDERESLLGSCCLVPLGQDPNRHCQASGDGGVDKRR